MLCADNDIVGHVIQVREHIVFPRRLFVDWSEGRRLAVEPLRGAVAQERIRGLRMVVLAEAVADDICGQHDHSAGPDVVCSCVKRAVDVAVL